MGRWRATESDRVEVDGPTSPPRTAELAVVGDRTVVASGTEVVAGRRHECGARPRAAYASADRLLVLTDSLDYHAWGHLGPAPLLDLGTGERVAELRGERAAALDGGRFLLGLEGDGTFETWLHDRDGALVTTWHSYGHYLVDAADGVRVVECDRRRPTRRPQDPPRPVRAQPRCLSASRRDSGDRSGWSSTNARTQSGSVRA